MEIDMESLNERIWGTSIMVNRDICDSKLDQTHLSDYGKYTISGYSIINYAVFSEHLNEYFIKLKGRFKGQYQLKFIFNHTENCFVWSWLTMRNPLAPTARAYCTFRLVYTHTMNFVFIM